MAKAKGNKSGQKEPVKDVILDEDPVDKEAKVEDEESEKTEIKDEAEKELEKDETDKDVVNEKTTDTEEKAGVKESVDIEKTVPVPEADKKTASVDSKLDTEEIEDTPPLPSRRSTAEQQTPKENPILRQLTEAFPNLEEKYIKAVIIASQGALDPAFNALLFLSDPEGSKDVELPSKPVKEVEAPGLPTRRNQSQVEQDEMLARQLDQQYNKSTQHRSDRRYERSERDAHEQRVRDRERRRQTPISNVEREELYGPGNDDSWSQFVEKDLPEIRDVANQKIQETATKINGWLSGVKKSWGGEGQLEDNNNGYGRNRFNENPSRAEQEVNEWSDEAPRPQPERRRFNSFGARVGEDSLESHGISLKIDDDDEDVPPQLPSRSRASIDKTNSATSGAGVANTEESGVVAETAHINTPDKKEWNALPPKPMAGTPTKSTPTSGITLKTDPDEDEFLINSDDEM